MFRHPTRTSVAATGLLSAVFAAWLWSQSKSSAVIVNPSNAQWTHQANDPPGLEAVVLRTGPGTVATELLVRFPGGHVIKPHWHDSNERIVVLEGRLAIGQGNEQVQVDAGGYAFLPAREMQFLSCYSQTRCAFYLAWDGNPASHPAPAPK